MALAALVAVIFIAGAATVALSGRAKPGSQAAGGPGADTSAGGSSALAAVAAARKQAAAWVASQASTGAIVACDPVMCAALQAHGVTASLAIVLSTTRADPLGSDLVVATPAVRSQFGARLAGVYAPVTLAAFGSGAARIDVRAVAADGAVAYRAQLAADVRARKSWGTLLLRNHHVHFTAAARAALAAGEVDSRLLSILATLAHVHPVSVTGFGDPGHGASAGVPLRSADIAWAGPRGARHPASLHRLRAILRAQRMPYLPSSIETVQISPRQAVLRVQYPVPDPLGLLGTSS